MCVTVLCVAETDYKVYHKIKEAPVLFGRFFLYLRNSPLTCIKSSPSMFFPTPLTVPQ